MKSKSGAIYVMQGDDSLVEVREQQYDSEQLLQQLLARYPNLLAGDQMNAREPRRWLLIAREMGVPDEDDGAGRWSLDHLFLDQDGVPTLVEVKRSSDTRIRREVVGQMLDYAANAVLHWPVETIQARFDRTCEADETEPGERLAELIGEERQPEDFWQLVKTNLQAGRIRLVFVADQIPPELAHVIEFLNRQMDPAEVLGVEIRQYVGEGVKTLVPRVIGVDAKIAPPDTKQDRTLSEDEYWIAFSQSSPKAEREAAKGIVAWARSKKLVDKFYQRKREAVFIPELKHERGTFYPIALRTDGVVALQMRWLKDFPPFDDPAVRETLRQELEQFAGLRLGASGMEGIPRVPLASLTSPDALQQFLRILDSILVRLRSN